MQLDGTFNFADANIYEDIDDELGRAKKYGEKFHSLHEALGIIEEELDEFKAHVYLKQALRDPEEVRKELIQLAAMAVKAIGSLENIRV